MQACSNDPQVSFHVIRNLVCIGRAVVTMRWWQLGFGRTASTSTSTSTSTSQSTPRNLIGFKDGTNNIKAKDPAAMAAHVWVGDEADQLWMWGGTYLVSRWIGMTDGHDVVTGQLDAGLFFICFNQDPRRQFVPIQRQLGQHDLLNEYIKHTGSGLFAVPAGVSAVGDWFGKALFA